MQKMDYFFKPKNVAIIGASRDQTKVGHVIFRNFIEGRFKGKVFPVNVKAKKILGRRCYSSVLDINERIDLAVVCIPSKLVPNVMEECGKKGVHAVIIISGGFKEVGNNELEENTRDIAKKHHMRVIGPNCLGVFDSRTGVDTIFLPRYKLERPEKGEIAFITQSGAVGSVVLDWMGKRGYKVSKFISYGNAMDVDEADLIEYLSKDDETKVICAYFEGVKEGRKFLNVSKKVTKRKPIIVLKGGITNAGTKAVSSHTGSLAGSFEIYTAAFRQSGIIQADNMEEIFDFARTLSKQPLPKGRHVQIITDGGGFGVLLADEIIKNGLELAEMGKESIERMRKEMPPYVVLKNPIDLTGDADTEMYRRALESAINDRNVDMIGLIVLLQVPRLGGDVVETVINAFKSSNKPIFVISAGGEYTEVLKKSLEDFGVPTFSYPESAARSMKILYDFAQKSKKANK